MKEVSEDIPRSAEVAQPGRALDPLPFAVRAKLKTESSPVQTRPSAPVRASAQLMCRELQEP